MLNELKEKFTDYLNHRPKEEKLRSFYSIYLEEIILSSIACLEQNTYERYKKAKKVISLWKEKEMEKDD